MHKYRCINKFSTSLVLVVMSLIVLAVLSCIRAQDNPWPGWSLISGTGSIQTDPETGQACLTVTGGEKFSESNYWTHNYPFAPNQVYKLACSVRKSPGTGGGRSLIGSNIVNLDLDTGTAWTPYTFYFRTPSELRDKYLRFGQWRVNGTIWFKDIQITSAQAVHKNINGLELGYGESISGQSYTARHIFINQATNYTRFLDDFQCYFNSNRWDIRLNNHITYKHQLANINQQSAIVKFNINYYSGDTGLVQVSRNKQDWIDAGVIDHAGYYTLQLSHTLFPANVIYIRFTGTGVNPHYQINDYAWQAEIDTTLPLITGHTLYIDELTADSTYQFEFSEPVKGKTGLHLQLKNPTQQPQHYQLKGQTNGIKIATDLLPGEQKSINLSSQLQTGTDDLTITTGSDNVAATYRINRSSTIPDQANYGHLLSSGKDCDLWWCNATHKVGKDRPAPAEQTADIRFAAARNEYEAFQFVIRGKQQEQQAFIHMSNLRHANGSVIPAARIKIFTVDYVTITHPSDRLGSVGDWPDPLPPLQGPVTVPAGENRPFWVQVHTPKGIPGGDYSGTVRVTIDGQTHRIPVTLHVWDFDLPDETHLQTAMSLYTSFIVQYHHFDNYDNVAPVFEKYLQDMREHRISPYDPFVMGNIAVTFDADRMQAITDFVKFDQLARKYLDDWGFNSFRLILQGIGRDGINATKAGNNVFYKRNSQEYNILMTDYLQQVQQHLEANGWLDKAYIYWKDEPDPEDYPLVKEINAFIHRAAPKLTRMLTEEPVPELYGSVDLWCPILNNYDPEVIAQRRQAGERIWWYICTSPKAPYPGLFIDHHAVDLRTWIWQSWQHKLDGILIWSVNYWNSEAASSTAGLQNPYQDPMSYMSTLLVKQGQIGFWGNGDGRFIYPPKSVFTSKTKNYEGPVSSIRWETLRDGLEDYEYLWLLQNLVNRGEQQDINPELLNQAHHLLTVPAEVTSSITVFSKAPDPIYNHRARLAAMIEELNGLVP